METTRIAIVIAIATKIEAEESAAIEDNLLFKVGDQVVHPQHGLGQVISLTVMQFVEGEKRPFFEIFFPDITLWVPVSRASSRIRKLTGKSEVANCRQVLKSPAEPLKSDYRLRQMELKDHLNKGTLTARCEVVRDLTAYGWRKPLRGSVAAFLETILEILYQEWAAVEKVTLAEATSEIQTLLERGKQANDTK